MPCAMRLALNADTTPLSVADTLVFKSFRERAKEAAQAGFPAVNVDRSEEGLTPWKVKEIAAQYGLQIASGFFQGRFYAPSEEARILEEARRQAEFSSRIGQECIFVSSEVSPPQRHARAGRIKPGDPSSLSAGQFEVMARLLEKIGQMWQEYGIELCFHPHVASYVEAPHEIDCLMLSTDPRLVKFGPDTGHLFFGGSDPIGMIDRYHARLGALHLKDVNAEVVAQVRRLGLDYQAACRMGVWTELGMGDIEFKRLFELLQKRSWSGWVIVETDHTGMATALESSRVSREYLQKVFGI